MRTEGDVDVARGIECILRSRLFHSEECRGRHVKSPVVYAIGAIRALELFKPPPDLVDLEIHLTRMGQRLFFPPNVAGWPGGLAWLDGQAVVARANFAAWLTEPSTPVRKGTLLVGTISLPMRRNGLKTPLDWLDAMTTLLLPTPLSRSASRVLCEHRSPDRCRMTRQLLSLPEAQVG